MYRSEIPYLGNFGITLYWLKQFSKLRLHIKRVCLLLGNFDCLKKGLSCPSKTYAYELCLKAEHTLPTHDQARTHFVIKHSLKSQYVS